MNRLKIIILWLIIFLLAGCTSASSPTTTPTPSATLPPSPTPLPDEGLHFLLTSTGSEPGQIKRLPQGWTDFQFASWGAVIRRGDLIQPPQNGTVTILCADLTVHTLMQEAGSPCQVSQPDLFWDGVGIVNPMAPMGTIPYIINPRNTRILDEHPLLRWHDTGASGYSISIVRDGEAIWQQNNVTGAELRYPDDAPSLEPGINYLLEVVDEDSGDSSGRDPVKGLGFQLLTAAETAVIHQKRDAILSLTLDEAAKNFTLGVYYAGQGLYGDALTALEAAATLQESPQVWLWRGKLLLAIRLNDDALTAYMDGAALADATGDRESHAQAQVELWRMTGDESYFDTAVALYQQLGDEQAITDLHNSR